MILLFFAILLLALSFWLDVILLQNLQLVFANSRQAADLIQILFDQTTSNTQYLVQAASP